MAETKYIEHRLFLTHNLIYVVLTETKRTMYIVFKNLYLDSFNEKVYVTYYNKAIGAYLHTILELIYHLFMYQILLYVLCEQN